MAKTNNLTAKEIEKKLKTPGRHGCGQGLYLEVDRRGRQSWVFIFTRNGRRREMGLGGLRDVTLAEARAKRDVARGQLAAGIDPLDAKQREATAPPVQESDALPRVPTFREMAATFVKDRESGWRNEKHRAQWRMTLGLTADKKTGYCLTLANKPVDAIRVEDVLAELRPLWAKKQETGSRIRGRIEAVLGAAKTLGYRSGPNPAAWDDNLEHLLAKRKKLQARGHHPAMPYKMLPVFMALLRDAKGMGAFALEFAILCASRSGEVRLAPWREVNMAECVWTIPPGRMKAGAEHCIPLSDRAIEILQAVAPLRPENDDGSALIFPGAGGNPLSDMTLAAAMNRLGADAYTPHGFRSSFRDWAGDCTSHSRETAEACLAHTLQGVEAAYRRSSAFLKRKAMLTEWAAYLDGMPAEDAPAAGARPFAVQTAFPGLKAANANKAA